MKKKFNHFIPNTYSMFDTSYCTEKGCLQPCARKLRECGIHTISDFPSVCKDYITDPKKFNRYRRKKIRKLCKLIERSLKEPELLREYQLFKKKVRTTCLSQKNGCENCPFANHRLGLCIGQERLEMYLDKLEEKKK